MGERHVYSKKEKQLLRDKQEESKKKGTTKKGATLLRGEE